MISLIVAYDQNFGIGIKNALPWKLSDDLKHFKDTTLNKPIIMGRKTFESIGKALPNRRNIILSTQPNLSIPCCEVYSSLTAAINACKNELEAVIIGGANIYQQSLSLVERMYITKVNTIVKADAFFPEWKTKNWALQSSTLIQASDKNEYSFQVQIWDRDI